MESRIRVTFEEIRKLHEKPVVVPAPDAQVMLKGVTVKVLPGDIPFFNGADLTIKYVDGPAITSISGEALKALVASEHVRAIEPRKSTAGKTVEITTERAFIVGDGELEITLRY